MLWSLVIFSFLRTWASLIMNFSRRLNTFIKNNDSSCLHTTFLLLYYRVRQVPLISRPHRIPGSLIGIWLRFHTFWLDTLWAISLIVNVDALFLCVITWTTASNVFGGMLINTSPVIQHPLTSVAEALQPHLQTTFLGDSTFQQFQPQKQINSWFFCCHSHDLPC